MAFWVCSEFCGEGSLRKVGLGGTHPLTQLHGFPRLSNIR
ncbi:lactoylglutathione lyase [Vibrio parahaemolyticus]|nr:lactoylglutathione lyase [Vibrio parahaemolyticus]